MNEYGIVIRKIRKEKGENLFSMSQKMGVSIAFLSALEVGKKQIPLDYTQKICEIYNLSEKDKKELFNSINLSNNKIAINLESMSDAQKDLSLAFARTINTASQKTLDELRKIIREEEEEGKNGENKNCANK